MSWPRDPLEPLTQSNPLEEQNFLKFLEKFRPKNVQQAEKLKRWQQLWQRADSQTRAKLLELYRKEFGDI